MRRVEIHRPVREFVDRLLKPKWHSGNIMLPDDKHRIEIETLPNSNVKFSYSTLIKESDLATGADTWEPMSAVEIETYTKGFWLNVVKALRCFIPDLKFAIEDKFAVAAIISGLPEAALLTMEDQREVVAEPAWSPRPEKTEKPRKSTRKAKEPAVVETGLDDLRDSQIVDWKPVVKEAAPKKKKKVVLEVEEEDVLGLQD